MNRFVRLPVFRLNVLLFVLFLALSGELSAQSGSSDSVLVRVHPSYAERGRFHRWFFGNNYRAEWAAPTRLPLIHISQFAGGLTPTQLGGGKQSKSLRLQDKEKREWVIRTVDKRPDTLLPPVLRQTFARDWLDDATSAQHPFSALVVAPIAEAIGVPHADPMIGVLAPDPALGIYEKDFANLVVLIEQREPAGESDNTEKMKNNLRKDNDNTIRAKEFLRARMLDVLLGDFDRHEDQWRWVDSSKGKGKTYVSIPRDRDMVFHVLEGFIPRFVSLDFIVPELTSFGAPLRPAKWQLFESHFANSYPASQFSHSDWLQEVDFFRNALTDSVFEEALRRLPAASYEIRHDQLLARLRSRREQVPAAMEAYYHFIQKIPDVQASDKNEWIDIQDAPGGAVTLRMVKISKNGERKEELMNKTYDPAMTKEIRLFTGDGHDSVVINTAHSPIRLRIIGGQDEKVYNLVAARKRVKLYDRDNGSRFLGATSRFRKHISADSLHTAYTETNLYNTWAPLLTVGLNKDDGFIFGAGFSYTKREGFRKYPYSSKHELLLSHSFSTNAFSVRYGSEWIHTIGHADFGIDALIRAPDNTANFFGRGNETVFDKSGNYKRYYRARYDTWTLDPSFRWRTDRKKESMISIGPSVYYYSFDADDNKGRFIEQSSLIGSYDSATIAQTKWHLGAVFQYIVDRRDNKLFTKNGSLFRLRLQAYRGMNKYAGDFAQLIPEWSVYRSLDRKAVIRLAARVGGTIGVGHIAFYQSATLGGQGNLLGYRQYRFAGQHSAYGNLELRIKLANIAGYIAPGELGLSGFYDIGRVWENDDHSSKWHNGTGAGVYFAPGGLFVFNLLMGHSSEGWYPYFTMGFRF